MAEYEVTVETAIAARLAIENHADRMTALRTAMVDARSTTVEDLNRNRLRLIGMGLKHDDVLPFLLEIGAAVSSAILKEIPAGGSRTFRLVSRHPWGEDRVM